MSVEIECWFYVEVQNFRFNVPLSVWKCYYNGWYSSHTVVCVSWVEKRSLYLEAPLSDGTLGSAFGVFVYNLEAFIFKWGYSVYNTGQGMWTQRNVRLGWMIWTRPFETMAWEYIIVVEDGGLSLKKWNEGGCWLSHEAVAFHQGDDQ